MKNDASQSTPSGSKLKRNLRLSATITFCLGVLSILSLVLIYLALSDIAKAESNLILEWIIVGICLIFIALFILSTFITLGFLLRTWNKWNVE
jgi:uncharacterized membrane protein